MSNLRGSTANWPDNNAVLALAIPLIKGFEGFRAEPYLDSASIPTIGYGTILYPNGHRVTMDDSPITEAQAEDYLCDQIDLKAGFVASCLEQRATAHQAAAMVSLAYNIGTLAFQESTVLHEFNLGHMTAAADAFLMWDKATVGGEHVVVKGLQTRREAERGVFLTKDVVA